MSTTSRAPCTSMAGEGKDGDRAGRWQAGKRAAKLRSQVEARGQSVDVRLAANQFTEVQPASNATSAGVKDQFLSSTAVLRNNEGGQLMTVTNLAMILEPLLDIIFYADPRSTCHSAVAPKHARWSFGTRRQNPSGESLCGAFSGRHSGLTPGTVRHIHRYFLRLTSVLHY